MKSFRNRTGFLLLLSLAALMLTSCGKTTVENSADALVSSIPAPVSSVGSSLSGENEQAETSPTAEGAETAESVSVATIPTYAGVYSSNGSPELDLYYEHIQVDGSAALQALVDEMLNQPAEQETEHLREEYLEVGTKSYFEQVALDSRVDAQVFSLLIRTTTYGEGAAHSNYTYRALTASAQTGEPLTLADLGVDEVKAKTTLTGLMEAYNRQDGVHPFGQDGYENDLTTLLGNYYLGTHEVVFLCNPYRFGQPFSAGAFRFSVPYDELNVAEQYRPEHSISGACIQDWWGNRFYAGGTKTDGTGEMTEKLNEPHGVVFRYEVTGLVHKD